MYIVFSQSICLCSQGAVRQGTEAAANAPRPDGDVVPPGLRGAIFVDPSLGGGEDAMCTPLRHQCTFVINAQREASAAQARWGTASVWEVFAERRRASLIMGAALGLATIAARESVSAIAQRVVIATGLCRTGGGRLARNTTFEGICGYTVSKNHQKKKDRKSVTICFHCETG